MKKTIIRMTEGDLHKLVMEAVEAVLREDGEGIGGGGATNCAGAMQGGGTNPGAGQYDVPFGGMVRRKGYSPKKDKVSSGMTQVDMKPSYDRGAGFSVNDKPAGHKG